jgi:acyl phosphate:glycerol-3-phosphate acyltransferase
MTMVPAYLGIAAVAYLLGSIPFGLILVRVVKGEDVRRIGSGNIGATNVARALGKGWAIAVLLGDAAKGFAPVWLARRLGFSALPIAIAGLSAIIGHMFTVFLRGRGGKGVATSLGVALALSPTAALLGFGVYIVVFAATRLSSLGSLLGVWTFSLFFVLHHAPAAPLVGLAIGGAALVTLRHRQNIARLLHGQEKRT